MNMTFGDAVRLGIGVVKETRDLFLYFPETGPQGCAIGTAIYSMGVTNTEKKCALNRVSWELCLPFWPWMALECSLIRYQMLEAKPIGHWISHLHCTSTVSREELADLADKLDPNVKPVDLWESSELQLELAKRAGTNVR